MEKHDNIKKLFSSKLKNFEDEVSASVWDSLDKRLEQQAAQIRPSLTRNSSKNSAIKRIVITASVAAAIVAGILFVPIGEDVTKIGNGHIAHKGTIAEKRKYEAIEFQEGNENKINQEESILTNAQYTAKAISPKTSVWLDVFDQKNGVNDQTPLTGQDTSNANEKPGEDIKSEPKNELNTKETFLSVSNTKATPLLARSRNSSNRLSLGIVANTGLVAQNVSEKGNNILFSKDIRGENLDKVLKSSGARYTLQHKQPVSFGLSVNKQLSHRLSLEAGLLYTHLSSKVVSESNFVDIEDSQYFNYLGVPLSLNYTFAELGKVRFYTSVGAMIQKDINGKGYSSMGLSKQKSDNQSLNMQVYYSQPYYVKDKIKQDKPQLSAHAAVGVSYPIYKDLNIYGNIGAAYYFEANNKYATIYSDKKTQLDLRIGLKFDL